VDAKYKLYDEKRLSTADIYQSFFYAYAYNDSANKTPAALLLYPSSGQRERQGYLQIRAQDLAVKAQLRALSISIPQAITEIRENTFGPISQVLLEVVDEFIEADKV
jgi:5-methylcytosine-specific restriction enzyme subunit McrC